MIELENLINLNIQDHPVNGKIFKSTIDLLLNNLNDSLGKDNPFTLMFKNLIGKLEKNNRIAETFDLNDLLTDNYQSKIINSVKILKETDNVKKLVGLFNDLDKKEKTKQISKNQPDSIKKKRIIEKLDESALINKFNYNEVKRIVENSSEKKLNLGKNNIKYIT
jgi:hypothetical protein